ncbi:hypothetical protein ACE6H2_005373 [Prunus campanulata]
MQLDQWLWSPARRGLGYMVHYKRNIESLNLQIEKFEVIKNDNQNLVDAFQLNGEEVKHEIKKWFEDANKAIADAAQLTGEVAATKNCISGMCPNLRWRYNLGKKAMEEKKAINKLLEKGDFPTISVQVPHPIEIESTMSTAPLITTRRLNVCHGMEINVKVHLNVLSEEDSSNLFAKKARMSFESVTFYNVARKVARECAGLPIALIAVAGALGDKDFDEWKEAAR